MASKSIEIIDLDDDDEHIGPSSGDSMPAASNGIAISFKAKAKMKNLWNRVHHAQNGTKETPVDDGFLTVKNGYSSDDGVSSTQQPAIENEQPTSTNSETDSQPEIIEERNLFDILSRSISHMFSKESPNQNPESTSTSDATSERPTRKRSRVPPVNDNGEGEQACCSKQAKLSNGANEAVGSPIPQVAIPVDDTPSNQNKQCDCMKNRRELLEKLDFYKEVLTKQKKFCEKLKAEYDTIQAKVDATGRVVRRTIAIQVDISSEKPSASVKDTRNAGPSGTKPKPNTPGMKATASAPAPSMPLPNLQRYPTQTFTTSITPPTRPVSTVQAPNAARTPITPPGGLPPTLPLTSPKAPVNQPIRPSNPMDHITIVSSTGTAKVMLAPNVVITQKTATTPVTSPNRPSPNQVLTAIIPSAPKANLAPEFSKPAAPQSAMPPRLVRAPMLPGGGQPLAPRGLGQNGPLARPPIVRPTLIPRSTASSIRPSASIRPSVSQGMPIPSHPPFRAVAQIRQPVPFRQPTDCQVIAVRSPSAVPSGLPPLPVLRSYVSPNDLNAASAALRPIPPKPSLKVNKDEDSRVTLCWDMPPLLHVDIKKYQLYSCKEGSNEGWTTVGGIEPMELPMACTLSSCVKGNKYYFVLTAEDTYGRYGPFSEICSIRV